MEDELEEYNEELDPAEILRAYEEARRDGGVDVEEGIRIFEAGADAIIAAHRVYEAAQHWRRSHIEEITKQPNSI